METCKEKAAQLCKNRAALKKFNIHNHMNATQIIATCAHLAGPGAAFRPIACAGIDRQHYRDAKGCASIHSSAINTSKQAGSLSDNEVFSCPKFMVLDVGRVYPQGWPHNLFCVDIPHVHSADLSSQRMVFQVRQGTEAMTTVNTTTAPKTGTTGTPASH